MDLRLILHQHLTKLPLFFLFLTFSLLTTPSLVLSQGTRTGFYSRSCPNAEFIVRDVVESHFQSDNTIAAGILRMHFHDCFVRGCDASVLINGPSSERTSGPNLSLRGFEVIDDAKTQLESVCPGVVSCADILALAARDSVDLSGGPSWQVPTGRRDGLVSSASDANNLPSFTDSVSVQKQKFGQFGLTPKEMVTLLGAHTIGTTQCQFFSYRLYNFTSGGGPDPSMDPDFVQRMRRLCPFGGDGSRRVALDTDSQFDFDTSYYSNLQDGQGVLESDQKLWTDASTSGFVSGYTGLISGILGVFRSDFARAMVKMSNIGVSTGTAGEIRRVCSAFN